MLPQIHILTYHSQNIGFPAPEDNDHLALAADLEALHDAGWSVRPLHRVVHALDDPAALDGLPPRCVCITFDDGCDMDFRDVDYPDAGLQRSFFGILEDFRRTHGLAAQRGLHATSFVIADPVARRAIDGRSLYGRGWISHDWWREADESGLLAIECHGWDHFHPDVRPDGVGADDFAESDRQVRRAAEFISGKTGRRPQFFAYPFGEVRPFLRDRYLREKAADHGCIAAFATHSAPLTPDCDRWELPRHVCGRDWRGPGDLLHLIETR